MTRKYLFMITMTALTLSLIVATPSCADESPEVVVGDRGEKGDKGDKGDKGEKGEKGEKGDKGDRGEQGESGTTGPRGTTGPKGDKGDKGDRGEQGESGTTGPRGATGATGDKGDKGDTGNANVSVYTQDISQDSWETIGSSSNGYLRLRISAPNILTKDVVKKWVVLVYVESSDYSDWALLPYYTERGIRVQVEVREGFITIKRDQNNRPITQSNFDKVKIVTIQPSSTGTISQIQNSNIDFKSYQSVRNYYNLNE